MNLKHYSDVEPRRFDSEAVKGVDGRVLIGQADGARNFCMRMFEVEPGGFTPRHSHPWEHEIFIHAGDGEMFGNGKWNAVKPGCTVFVPSGEEHQIRNTGAGKLTVICLIPSGAPEL